MSANDKIEFAKRVAHFQRLFADKSAPAPKNDPVRVHGKAVETGRALGERGRAKELDSPSFVIE